MRRSVIASELRPCLAKARLARQGWAGEKSGLFEHPACGSPVVLDVQSIEFHRAIIVFLSLLEPFACDRQDAAHLHRTHRHR